MAEKVSLAQALARFDRKERRFVVGKALGYDTGLAQTFCDDVARVTTGLPPLRACDTQWFTDYHIDWLAGAVHVYAHGEDQCLSKLTCNGDKSDGRLIHGNQQDIDLLLVQDVDIILLEAKWFGSWDDGQLESKLKRLNILRQYAAVLCQRAAVEPVRMHFVFMSPQQPEQRTKNVWAAHGGGTELHWLSMLPANGQTNALAMGRCDKNGKSNSSGSHWQVTKQRMPGTP